MKFKIDHDFHIHSYLSLCSDDPRQNPDAILQYARENHLKKICLTDHFWDEKLPGASDWYKKQNLVHIKQVLPLPQNKEVRFCFGAEAEMDKFFNVGVAEETFDEFDFVIIPTTHLHMNGFTLEDGIKNSEVRAQLWFDRLAALLQMRLPWKKIGIAHLTCPLLGGADRKAHVRILELLNTESLRVLFRRIAELGAGVELNFNSFAYEGEELEKVLRIYRIAKEQGCKFYLGSDAHHPASLEKAHKNFENIIELLQLEESDKFDFAERY